MQKPTTTPLTISHIDYSPSGDVILMYCTVGTALVARPGEEDGQTGLHRKGISYGHYALTRNDETSFKAGQFMLLAAEIDGKLIKRSYSIATTPQLLQEQGLIGFSIKRVEEGVFSTRATKVAKAGDTLTMTGPLGKMVDHQDCSNYLLISAGSGLSPIYSLYQNLIQSSRNVRIANIFGERYFSHVLPCVHRDRVLSGGMKDPTINPTIDTYSQCFLSQDEHEGYCIGRVQLGLVNALNRLATSDVRVFICGAPAMVDEVRNLLIAEYGIDPVHIHFEKY